MYYLAGELKEAKTPIEKSRRTADKHRCPIALLAAYLICQQPGA